MTVCCCYCRENGCQNAAKYRPPQQYGPPSTFWAIPSLTEDDIRRIIREELSRHEPGLIPK